MSDQAMSDKAMSDKANHGKTVARPGSLDGNLRQMIAVLGRERQALASLDADELFCSTREKQSICEALEPFGPEALDPQTRELANTARQLNEVNRRVRNLLAANVAARLEAYGASRRSYPFASAALV
jgi:alkylhydroperoxidase/carboxymuconolactone decarboxylase family protein YurZ